MGCRRVILVAALVTAAAGCRSAPTSILLEISAPQGGFVCDELRLAVYDSSRVVVDGRRLPPSGAPALPSAVVLYPPALRGAP